MQMFNDAEKGMIVMQLIMMKTPHLFFVVWRLTASQVEENGTVTSDLTAGGQPSMSSQLTNHQANPLHISVEAL